MSIKSVSIRYYKSIGRQTVYEQLSRENIEVMLKHELSYSYSFNLPGAERLPSVIKYRNACKIFKKYERAIYREKSLQEKLKKMLQNVVLF